MLFTSKFKPVTYIFTDDVPALKSVWFLGENFLKDAFLTFRAMNTKEAQSSQSSLYLYQNYNITPWHAPMWSNTKAFLVRVLNALIEGLNEETHLPQYILVILDKDLISSAELYDYGISSTI